MAPPRNDDDTTVREVIGVASALMEAERAAPEVDLREVGEEVGIPGRYVAAAEEIVAARRKRARFALGATFVGALLVAVALVLHFARRGADAQPPKPLAGAVVAFDLLHGDAPRGGRDALEAAGAQVKLLDARLDDTSLRGVSLLVLDMPRRGPLGPAEIEAIATFVDGGGGLIVTELGWAWKEYEKAPLPDLPANRLGKRMGFAFDDRILDPPASPDIDAGPIVRTEAWVAGGVEVSSRDPLVLLRDEKMRAVVASGAYGRGRIVLVGHPKLLDENPRWLLWLTAHAARR